MARNNYSYQKHRREQAKKKKKEEKLQKKLDKKNKPADDIGTQATGIEDTAHASTGAGEPGTIPVE